MRIKDGYDIVQDPCFPIPTVELYFRVVDGGTFMVNYDIGETFLNFIPEPRLRSHAGIELSSSFPEETIVDIPIVQDFCQ